MENKLMIFENNAFGKVRTLNLNGEPWFVAADVCKALELGNPSMTVERLDDDEKGISTIDTLGGKQRMAIINEPGLYSLVITSRKPEAKAFKRWITHEVIPAIRKHGVYITDEKLKLFAEHPELIFCAEQYKAAKHLTGKQLSELFGKYHVWEYLYSCFEALHTTGTNYIIEDIDLYIGA